MLDKTTKQKVFVWLATGVVSISLILTWVAQAVFFFCLFYVLVWDWGTFSSLLTPTYKQFASLDLLTRLALWLLIWQVAKPTIGVTL